MSRVFLCLAVAVLVGSAALRLTGLDWLLPSMIEQDAHIPVQVRLMEHATDDPARVLDWGAYPHLVARLTLLLTPSEASIAPTATTELAAQLDRACWPVLRVRLIVALLSLLAVPATWLLARLWLSRPWSLVAAALMGTSLLALHFGGQARAHGAAAGLDALAVLACVHLRRRGNLPAYGLAGLAVAAAVACLQSGFATLLPLAVAHAGLARERGRGRRQHLLLALPLACVALAVLAFYPFVFEQGAGESAAYLGAGEGIVQQAKHKVFLDKFNGMGFLLLGRDLWHWEPALAVASALGAACWIFGRRRAVAGARPSDRLVVLSFVIPYALVVGLYERSYERFLLPLIPFLAVLATWGLARCVDAVEPARKRAALGVALAFALLALPTAVAWRLAAARRAPSTIEQAADWVAGNVSPATPIVTGRTFSLPLPRTKASEALDARVVPDMGLGWTSYQRRLAADARPAPAWPLSWIPFTTLDDLRNRLSKGIRPWIASLPAELCVSEVFTGDRVATELSIVTLALRNQCETLVRLSPDANPRDWETPLVYQDETTGPVAPMAWRVLHAERLGPVIEIYRVRNVR